MKGEGFVRLLPNVVQMFGEPVGQRQPVFPTQNWLQKLRPAQYIRLQKVKKVYQILSGPPQSIEGSRFIGKKTGLTTGLIERE